MEERREQRKKVMLVDGFLIRNTLDDDFALVHENSNRLTHFSSKFYIPADEIWLDHIYEPEREMLLESHRLFMLSNKPHALIREELKKQFLTKGITPDFISRTEMVEELKVVYVDGKIVRSYFDPEFTLGGHDLVYPSYVPAGEIWLDNLMDSREFPFLLLHEQVERQLMTKGQSYDLAHDQATAADKAARRLAGGAYPGDANYPWINLSNQEIIKKYYV